jgi:hypothetical protein
MEYSEADHLNGKEQIVHDIYEKLLFEIAQFGSFTIEPKKTSMHLVNRYAFAGVYTRKNYLLIEVPLNYRLMHKRVQKIEQASANRYHIRFKLETIAELDPEFLGWLRDAYELRK